MLKIILPALMLTAFCFGEMADGEDKYNFKTYEQSPCIFKLQDYDMTKPLEAGICFGVEVIIETFTDTFGLEFDEDFRVTLVIFNDRDKYNMYFRDRFGSDALADGYFSLSDNECVVWKNKDVKDMLNVLFHETQHLLMAHHYPHCPMWLNEGLSQYFQGLNVIGRNKRIYVTDNCKEWNMKWLREGFSIEPKEYIDLGFLEWNELRERDVLPAYLIGYSMTLFLMENSHNREVLNGILSEAKKDFDTEEVIIKKGGKEYVYNKPKVRPSSQVIDEHYPGGYSEFERNWKRWIPRSRSYQPVRIMREKISSVE